MAPTKQSVIGILFNMIYSTNHASLKRKQKKGYRKGQLILVYQNFQNGQLLLIEKGLLCFTLQIAN